MQIDSDGNVKIQMLGTWVVCHQDKLTRLYDGNIYDVPSRLAIRLLGNIYGARAKLVEVS